MTIKTVVAATVAALVLSLPGSAQSAADLLQKGIYAQETAGDLDAAIRIFRQVAGSNSGNRAVAAQAQYQLVLCMLQRGDRTGAAGELDTMVRSFPDQQELVEKARKLLPGSGAALPSPWGEGESSQLSIKRDGAATGEYLYYSIDRDSAQPFGSPDNPKRQLLRSELKTKKSTRSVMTRVDRNTLEPVTRPDLWSDDEIGDPAAEPIAGPAIDVQQSVFAMRRLPLAVGLKTTLTTLPFTLSHLAPSQVELAVTGIEAVEVTAGKYKCYKISFGSIGQTFWIGVEGSRPLVKIRSGNVEAELVHVWGPENPIETAFAFLPSLGWKLDNLRMGPGQEATANAQEDVRPGVLGSGFGIRISKIYTPPAELPQALRRALDERSKRDKVRPESVQTRVIGGQQALSCIADPSSQPNSSAYYVWIATEGAFVQVVASSYNLAVSRWTTDRILAAAKRFF